MAGVELHVKETFNYEEAAHVATDVVGNLEGLPGEVSFLLEEIRDKDERITLLVNRINSRHYSMTKHPARQIANASTSGGSSSSSVTLPIPAGTPLPLQHLGQKEATALGKIQGEWDKIEALQDEKIKLAERMERIVGRARERARAEWTRVGGIDVEELDLENQSLSRAWELGSAEIALPPSGLGTGSDVRQKKRKPQALPLPPPSITHPPSSMPPPPMPSRPALSARSSAASYRGGRQKSMSTTSDADVDDADAEGEVDVGDGDGDDTIYCTCRSRSYGEMIGCDNDNCEIEWFHVKCVGVTPPVPDTWYCPDCVRKLGRDKKNKKR